jgi:CRISPR-associated endonuclease/helicase Cas3
MNEKVLNLNEYLAKPDKTIEEHTVDLLDALKILKDMGYIKSERIYKMSRKACELHDLGKVNESFQKRVKSIDGKKIRFNEANEVCHNVLSLCFFNRQDFENEPDYLCVAHAVLNHHDYGDPFDILNKKSELINKLIANFDNARFPRPGERSKLAKQSTAENSENILVKGFLHKCDYSASAGYKVEYKNNFLLESLEGLKYKWNSLQKFCKQNTDNNIIVTAPTGMGKTEAGLLWLGDNKSFFILPIRTAINAMYNRIKKEVLLNKNINERLAILHSSSMEYYVKEDEKSKKDKFQNNEDEEINLLEYEKKGKSLSLPLNVSTMDQIFDFVFKYQGYELKLATLSYSKLVIDEIQMYSADLLAYLICGIEKIIEIGGKVAILTATLPPFIYDLLNKEKNLFVRQSYEDDDINTIRHNVVVKECKINSTDIYDFYIKNKQSTKKNKILVVCNTVKKAQQIYAELKDSNSENYIQDTEILNILHSSFIKKDRNFKEDEILKFGKTYLVDENNNDVLDENNNKIIDERNGIWITTSLVEASLDIDFDYLFTELQDLSSLFQRFGRCNRKGKKDCNFANCFVYTEIDEALFVRDDKGFIDKEIYEASKEAILLVKGLITEKQKSLLINKYLTTEKLKQSGFIEKFNKQYDFIKGLRPYSVDKTDVKLRNILSQTIIPSPIYTKNKNEIYKLVENLNICTRGIKKYNEKSSKIKLSEEQTLELDILKNKKVQIRQKLYDFTVDVANYIIYDKNSYGKRQKYDDVVINDYEKIMVIECEYDDMGFRKIDYKNLIRKADFL